MASTLTTKTTLSANAQAALEALRVRHSTVGVTGKTLAEAMRADGSAKVWVARAAVCAMAETGLSQSALSRETGIPRTTLIGYLNDGKALESAGHAVATTREPTTAEIALVEKVRTARAKADKAAKAKAKRLAAEAQAARDNGTTAEGTGEGSTPAATVATTTSPDALTYAGAEALMLQAVAALRVLEKGNPEEHTEADAEARNNIRNIAGAIVKALR